MPDLSRSERLEKGVSFGASGTPITEDTAIVVTTTREVKDLITHVVVYQTQNEDGSWTKPTTARNLFGGAIPFDGVEAVLEKIKELDA